MDKQLSGEAGVPSDRAEYDISNIQDLDRFEKVLDFFKKEQAVPLIDEIARQYELFKDKTQETFKTLKDVEARKTLDQKQLDEADAAVKSVGAIYQIISPSNVYICLSGILLYVSHLLLFAIAANLLHYFFQ